MEARDLRVSDAEREHVGQLLQRAVGQGMLSLGEFTERMDTALGAKTRGELNVVLADLPGIRLIGDEAPQQQPQVPSAPQPVYGQPPTFRPGAGDVVRGRMSNVTRKGPWHVPSTLQLNSRFSSVNLDFTEAIMTSQVVEIYVDDFCSSVSLIVPDEATVDLNGLQLIGANANSRVRTGPPIGKLHIVVRGRIRFGSLEAKHPFGTSIRRMMGGGNMGAWGMGNGGRWRL
ncbi:DUF1707 SHOCT-like domain-containing protein [Antrihabitans cavernicola]|uniref:DUF1707 domain-containing protein n=1 Tax=Antrihabitans cavernicola TaxID=2495913 RepID=A0A5A7S1H0_9NOCA|nr:DUF1707 domain-containing protein [Spelaeibacter cavernicola]KAA0016317.1 DUF1707 domain-containing protein [Spelaeibacter cavernicola]